MGEAPAALSFMARAVSAGARRRAPWSASWPGWARSPATSARWSRRCGRPPPAPAIRCGRPGCGCRRGSWTRSSCRISPGRWTPTGRPTSAIPGGRRSARRWCGRRRAAGSGRWRCEAALAPGVTRDNLERTLPAAAGGAVHRGGRLGAAGRGGGGGAGRAGAHHRSGAGARPGGAGGPLVGGRRRQQGGRAGRRWRWPGRRRRPGRPGTPGALGSGDGFAAIANRTILRRLAAIQRPKPARALCETLLQLADLTPTDLDPLREAAAVALEVEAGRAAGGPSRSAGCWIRRRGCCAPGRPPAGKATADEAAAFAALALAELELGAPRSQRLVAGGGAAAGRHPAAAAQGRDPRAARRGRSELAPRQAARPAPGHPGRSARWWTRTRRTNRGADPAGRPVRGGEAAARAAGPAPGGAGPHPGGGAPAGAAAGDGEARRRPGRAQRPSGHAAGQPGGAARAPADHRDAGPACWRRATATASWWTCSATRRPGWRSAATAPRRRACGTGSRRCWSSRWAIATGPSAPTSGWPSWGRGPRRSSRWGGCCWRRATRCDAAGWLARWQDAAQGPVRTRAALELAGAYLQADKRQRAVACLERALADDPKAERGARGGWSICTASGEAWEPLVRVLNDGTAYVAATARPSWPTRARRPTSARTGCGAPGGAGRAGAGGGAGARGQRAALAIRRRAVAAGELGQAREHPGGADPGQRPPPLEGAGGAAPAAGAGWPAPRSKPERGAGAPGAGGGDGHGQRRRAGGAGRGGRAERRAGSGRARLPRPGAAAPARRQGRRRCPPPRRCCACARSRWRAGRSDKAQDLLDSAISRRHRQPEEARRLGRRPARRGRLEVLRTVLDRRLAAADRAGAAGGHPGRAGASWPARRGPGVAGAGVAAVGAGEGARGRGDPPAARRPARWRATVERLGPLRQRWRRWSAGRASGGASDDAALQRGAAVRGGRGRRCDEVQDPAAAAELLGRAAQLGAEGGLAAVEAAYARWCAWRSCGGPTPTAAKALQEPDPPGQAGRARRRRCASRRCSAWPRRRWPPTKP